MARGNRSRLIGALVGLLASGSAAVTGYYVHFQTRMTLAGVSLLVGVGLLAVEPLAPALLALPGVWLPIRAGNAIWISDVFVLVAGVLALLNGVHREIAVIGGRLFRGFAVFFACLIPSLAYNFAVPGALEAVHRIQIVLLGVLAGAWLVLRGRERAPLRLLLVISLVMAVISVADYAASGGPAFPLGFHKNFAGSVLSIVLLLVLAAPANMGVNRPMVQRLCMLVLGAGVFATQSRGSMLGLALGALVWTFRRVHGEPGGAQARTKLLMGAGTIAITYFAITSVRSQLAAQESGDTPVDSLTQRQDVEGMTHDLWEQHPWVGVGLRFFRTEPYTSYQPSNNLFNEALAEAGTIGAIGLAFFLLVAVRVTWKLRTPLGHAALIVLLADILHGQVDIFWANPQLLYWVVVGLGIGAEVVARQQAGEPDRVPESPASTRDTVVASSAGRVRA